MLNTDLTNQRQVFVGEYVRSGDHLEAAKKAGYKETHTLRNQACKLRRECADEITEELHRNFAEIAPRALNILTDLAENAESESVRLGATRDLLDRAGFRPVDRHEIVKEKSVEELNAQLVSLVGENGAEMLISAFKSRRSISGPEHFCESTNCTQRPIRAGGLRSCANVTFDVCRVVVRRRRERMMSRCFIVYWLVLEGGYCFVPEELYFNRKMSLPPEFVFPSKSPEV
jgi:hypothetical protein